MSTDERQLDDELDRLLRTPPVPRGLVARLAAISEEPQDSLEQSLCNVPVPADLQERLLATVDGDSGADLEHVIRAARDLRDESLDARLRDVPIPFGLEQRLRRMARPRVTRQRLAAVAALVLLFFSIAGGPMLGRLRGLFGTTAEESPQIAAAPILDLQTQLQAAGDLRFTAPAQQDRRTPPSFTGIDLQLLLGAERSAVDRGLSRFAAARSPKTSLFQTADWVWEGVDSSVRKVQGGRPIDELPDLIRFPVRVPRGVEVPLGAEARKFLLDYGVFPRVTPREFPTSIVPFTHDTSGYELARAYLAAGDWPPAEQMRAEEFLAAADFAFGRPTDRAARLLVAGSAAPWNPPSTPERPLPPEQIGRLLQLAVQARELPAAARRPTYLTVGIDVTTSMQAGGRMEMIKNALRSLVSRLGGADRLTLVALGGANPVIVEDGSRAELEQLLAAVDFLSAQGSGNLSAGVLTACATAARREPPRNIERRVVVISDAFGEFDPTGVRTVDRFLQTSAARTMRLDLIDVSRENDETPWDELVRRREGKIYRVDTGERIRSALMEALTGRSQTVASEAVLSLTFHPQSVVSYRLVGHEPTALAGLLPQRVEVDLHAGQAAVLLYELQLNGGKDQDVATAVLRWRDPVDGTPQEFEQKITRGMLSPAFEKAAPTLQLATVAAAVSGYLRHSPWGDNVAPAEVLQWVRRLQRLGTVRGVEPWVGLVEQLQNLPPPRRQNNRTSR